MKHLIIGAGPAGIIAAETLRDNDPGADITLLSAEPEPPYSRMAIPYLLIGNINEQGSYLRHDSNHFARLGVTLIQDRVTGIDSRSKSVTLDSGDTLDYDKCLIATGSSPIKPPIPGIELDSVHSCWTLQDARDIMSRARPDANVVLIGAGFIGCIILEALVKRGVKLTVVETGDRMVPRMLNDKAGGLLKSWCEYQGVTVKTSSAVTSIDDDGDSLTVRLESGEKYPADLVITATGVRSNTGFLSDSGIAIDQGVLVNDHLQTSDPDVYAAGDVAQGLDFSTGQQRVQAIQPTATDHGRIAALNMCGLNARHHGSVNMNVLDTLGLVTCSFGAWMGEDGGESTELFNPDEYQYINLQFADDVLVGASAAGRTQHVGILRGLIESRIRLGVWKDRLLTDPTGLMEAYMACTQEIGLKTA